MVEEKEKEAGDSQRERERERDGEKEVVDVPLNNVSNLSTTSHMSAWVYSADTTINLLSYKLSLHIELFEKFNSQQYT